MSAWLKNVKIWHKLTELECEGNGNAAMIFAARSHCLLFFASFTLALASAVLCKNQKNKVRTNVGDTARFKSELGTVPISYSKQTLQRRAGAKTNTLIIMKWQKISKIATREIFVDINNSNYHTIVPDAEVWNKKALRRSININLLGNQKSAWSEIMCQNLWGDDGYTITYSLCSFSFDHVALTLHSSCFHTMSLHHGKVICRHPQNALSFCLHL